MPLLRILNGITGCGLHMRGGHIRLSKRINHYMRIVTIGALIGQAHVIPSSNKQWIMNHRIDLRTFDEIYYISLFNSLEYLFR